MSDFQRPEWAERFRPPDHLWPARPEYLRRGSVVVPGGEGLAAVVVAIDGGDLILAAEHGGYGWRAACAVSIDLRDVTARAHAAMAYTYIVWSPCADVYVKVDGLTWTTEHETLSRMRMLDEFVTVAEARAALAWAESVVGVSDGS